MNLSSYTELLKKHDWHYQNSDDHRHYVSGKKSVRQLQLIAQAHGALYQQAFNEAYLEHRQGGNISISTTCLPFPRAGYAKIENPF